MCVNHCLTLMTSLVTLRLIRCVEQNILNRLLSSEPSEPAILFMAATLRHCPPDEAWLPCVAFARDLEEEVGLHEWSFRSVVARWGCLDRDGRPNAAGLPCLANLCSALLSKACAHEAVEEAVSSCCSRPHKSPPAEDWCVKASLLVELVLSQRRAKAVDYPPSGVGWLLCSGSAAPSLPTDQPLTCANADSLRSALLRLLDSVLAGLHEESPNRCVPTLLKFAFLALRAGGTTADNDFLTRHLSKGLVEALAGDEETAHLALSSLAFIAENSPAAMLEEHTDLAVALQRLTTDILLPRAFFGGGAKAQLSSQRGQGMSLDDSSEELDFEDEESVSEGTEDDPVESVWTCGRWTRERGCLLAVWSLAERLGGRTKEQVMETFLSWLEAGGCLESAANVHAFLATLGAFVMAKVALSQDVLMAVHEAFCLAFKFHRKSLPLVTALVVALRLLMENFDLKGQILKSFLELTNTVCAVVSFKAVTFLTNLCSLAKVLLAVSFKPLFVSQLEEN